MQCGLLLLPDEILQSILRHVNPRDSIALERTARRFTAVANEPLLWRFYCVTTFNFWDTRHEFPKKLSRPTSSTDWKRLYAMRSTIDAATTKSLNSILSSQRGRIKKIQDVIDFGYDVKDTLVRHSHAKPDLDDYLARRYYSNAILGCLHRNIAIPEWARLGTGEAISLERALGAFDLFVPESRIGSLEEITAMLDAIVVKISSQYSNFAADTSPRSKALLIASYLRENNLTGIDRDRDYHELAHNFLGMALKDRNHNSLPLISAAIYCYIAQRLGLKARLCGFPFHVYVIIIPPPGIDMDGRSLSDGSSGEVMYMDPFRSTNETPVSDLKSQLNYLGATAFEQSHFLRESLTSEIVLRCGKNIVNSIELITQPLDPASSSVDPVGAKYAGLWSTILCIAAVRPMELRQYLPALMELFATDFPSDIGLIEHYLVPLCRGFLEYEHLLESLHIMRAVDEMPKQLHHRTDEHQNVRYHIGQVFCHRRYNYRAIITGWDVECGANEEWMRRMGIDRLQWGRYQSFYHALVEDRSVRYVAEENIEIVTPSIVDLPSDFVAIAGKYFKRWDEKERKFVSNIRDEYPDD